MADDEPLEMNPSAYPLSTRFKPIDGRTIFRTDDWWKAVVTYRFEESSDTSALGRGVYLWIDNDGTWKKKQEYLINSIDTWEADKEHIDEFLANESGDPPRHEFDEETLPVSDYYTVGDAVTIFNTDEWWKAVTRIDAKGDWTTREVVVYVWQYFNGKWRRRQKYAIRRRSDWEEEANIISSHLKDSFESEFGSEGHREEFDPETAKEDLRRLLKMQQVGGEFD